MTYAEQALERLSGYEGDEYWSDCIDGEGYDDHATQADLMSDRNEVAIYTDGSRLEYIEAEHCWTAIYG